MALCADTGQPPGEPLKVGLVAGEASGDILGAGLMAALRSRFPEVQFSGMGGPRMIAQGLDSMFDMERLAVMGLLEPLKRLPELLRMRRQLREHFLQQRPHIFVGIDSPDFTLGLELALRQQGITTAHYVSPSVWAWRQGRIHKIKKAVDLMLTLFPFEADFYRQHGQEVAFVGHPLADELPLQPDIVAARQALNLAEDATWLAILPGSRRSEIAFMGEVFLRAAAQLAQANPGLRFIIPAANGQRLAELQQLLQQLGDSTAALAGKVQLVEGQSHTVMAAADLVLMTSGTTTLEAMLLKKPMVVGYRMSGLAYFLLTPFVKIPHIALPNLLAGERLVPELLQQQLTVPALVDALQALLHSGAGPAMVQRFEQLHHTLRRDASASAASAVAGLLQSRGVYG